jgi:hypothetical protein
MQHIDLNRLTEPAWSEAHETNRLLSTFVEAPKEGEWHPDYGDANEVRVILTDCIVHFAQSYPDVFDLSVLTIPGIARAVSHLN